MFARRLKGASRCAKSHPHDARHYARRVYPCHAGFNSGAEAAGMKWVADTGYSKRGLPYVTGLLILNDLKRHPIALMIARGYANAPELPRRLRQNIWRGLSRALSVFWVAECRGAAIWKHCMFYPTEKIMHTISTLIAPLVTRGK